MAAKGSPSGASTPTPPPACPDAGPASLRCEPGAVPACHRGRGLWSNQRARCGAGTGRPRAPCLWGSVVARRRRGPAACAAELSQRAAATLGLPGQPLFPGMMLKHGSAASDSVSVLGERFCDGCAGALDTAAGRSVSTENLRPALPGMVTGCLLVVAQQL